MKRKLILMTTVKWVRKKIEIECLIVLDCAFDFAEKAYVFANFLKVGKKFKYLCFYIFHIN